MTYIETTTSIFSVTDDLYHLRLVINGMKREGECMIILTQHNDLGKKTDILVNINHIVKIS